MENYRKRYLDEPRPANRDWSQRLCNVMDIDENDIKAAACDLMRNMISEPHVDG